MNASIRWLGWVVVLMLSVASQPVLANEPPVIGPLAEVMMYSGVGRVVVPLVITDAETPVGMLSVQVRTSNGTIIPVGGASVAFRHGAWELSLDPTGGRTGVTTATVSVTDPDGAQATGTLRVQVVDSVSRLAVSPIPAQRVWQGGPDIYVGFTAGDGTGVDPKLTVTSSVPDLWRNGGITRSGVVPSGWLLRLVPSADRSGSGWITVTANWGTVQTSTSFLLVVQSPLLMPASDSTIASLKANTSIVAADFDRDGIQELAVTRKTDTNGPAAIRFLRQNGDAWIEFGPIIPGSYGELECPDFDGDGRMDLATLTNERLAVWRNRPTADGGFAFEAQTLPWGPTW